MFSYGGIHGWIIQLVAFREGELVSVVDRFYEAAVRPVLWKSVLHQAAAAMGAEGALLISHPHVDATVCSDGVTGLIDAFVREEWVNIRAVRGIQRDRWKLHSESTIATANELDDLPFYSDFLTRMGFRWFVGTTLAADGDSTILISVERRARADPFSQRELEAIERTLPHLRAACRLALHLGMARGEGMLEAFERMRHGAMLLDARGRAVRVNRSMESMFGRIIGLVGDRPVALDRGANAALQRAIAESLSIRVGLIGTEPIVVRIPGLSARPVMAYCAPLPGAAEDIFHRGNAMLVIVDGDNAPFPDEEVLRRAFELTPGESRLAAAIAAGLSPKEAAERLKLTQETARTILKRVFAKAGVSRQSELVALVARTVLRWAP